VCRLRPHIAPLGTRGLALDGRAPSSWTKPSTASILTGLHPLRHRAVGRLDTLSPNVTTLAEALRALGFQTRAVSTNDWVSREFGFGRGFDSFRSLWPEAGEPAPA